MRQRSTNEPQPSLSTRALALAGGAFTSYGALRKSIERYVGSQLAGGSRSPGSGGGTGGGNGRSDGTGGGLFGRR